MKVIHIIDSGGFGGAERYIIDVVSCMKENDNLSIEVLTFFHNELFSELANEKGVNITSLFENNDISAIEIIRKIKRIYKEDVNTIFHTHGYKANIFVRFALLVSNAKIITTVHSTLNYWDSKYKSTIYKFLDKLTSFKNNTIICVSDYIKIYYKTIFNKSKLFTIYNGVDSRQYNVTKNTNFGSSITLVNIGSLSNVKNQITIVKAVKYLIQELNMINIELVIIGEGPNKEKILDFVHKSNLSENIKLIGFKANIVDFLLQSDVYISASTDESFGLSIVEAMMVGLPIISSSVGGVPEIIPSDDYGLLYQNPFDEIDLATTIKKLIENQDIARIIAKNGYERAQNKFTLEKLCDSLLVLYKNMN